MEWLLANLCQAFLGEESLDQAPDALEALREQLDYLNAEQASVCEEMAPLAEELGALNGELWSCLDHLEGWLSDPHAEGLIAIEESYRLAESALESLGERTLEREHELGLPAYSLQVWG